MAGSLNKVQIIGNLGRDPEVRSSTIGKIVTLSVATSETWNDKSSGERRERTEWHRVVIFNENLGSVAEKYLTKGRKVYLEGQLETRKYTDNDGNEKYTTEVVIRPYRGELTLLDSRQDEGGGDRDRGGGGRDDRGGGRERGRDDRGGGRDTRGRDDSGRDARGGYGSGRDRDDRRDDRRAAGSTNGSGREASRDDDRRGGPTWTSPQADKDLDDEIPF